MGNTFRQYTVSVDTEREKVYRTLRDNILSMTLKPGTVISTKEVSEKMDVSRTPVREAFIQLQHENLLDIAPQKGTAVALIDLQRVHQEWFIRYSLELANIEKFTRCAERKTVDKLREYIKLQKEALEENRSMDYMDLDNRFHQVMFEVTGEYLSGDIIASLNGHYDRIRFLSIWEGEIPWKALGEHEIILDAVESGNAFEARSALESHLSKLLTQESAFVADYPDYFKTDSGEDGGKKNPW